MTEAEWLTCDEPSELVGFLDSRLSRRKLRLIICALCRLSWHKFTDERSRRAVIAVEESVESPSSDEIPQSAQSDAIAAYDAVYYHGEAGADYMPAQAAAILAFGGTIEAMWCLPTGGRGAAIMRDIAGNLFRPASLNPSWRTDSVLALACQMYESRDFDVMPILADALQDAGCNDAHVLDHCRRPGPHVRGCWVVDLVLGKH